MTFSDMALDFAKGAPNYVVNARVGERRANRVRALVLDHGIEADLSGCEVSFECMGDGWHAVAECEVDGSFAEFELPTFDRPGDIATAYIRASGNGRVRTTGDFIIRVQGKGARPCNPFMCNWT